MIRKIGVIGILMISTLLAMENPKSIEQLPHLFEAADLLAKQQAYTEAEALIQNALTLAETQGNTAWQAKAHNGLGMVLRLRGAFVQAISHFERAHEMYLSLGRIEAAAIVDRNLGIQYRRLGLFDMAEVHLQSAEKVHRKLQQPCEVALCQMERGTTLTFLKDYSEAQKVLHAALAQFEQCTHQHHRLHLAGTHDRLGKLFHRQDRFEDAENSYLKGLELTPAPALNSRGHSYANLAELAYDRKLMNESLELADLALEAMAATGNQDDLLNVRAIKAKTLLAMDDLDASVEVIEPAFETLLHLQTQQGGSQFHRSFLHVRDQLIQSYLTALLAKAKRGQQSQALIAQALQVYESSRARALKTMKQQDFSTLSLSAFASETAHRRGQWLASLQAETPIEQQSKLKEAFLSALRRQQKAIALSKQSVPTASVKLRNIQARLKEQNATALVFARGLHHWHGFVVDGTNITHFEIAKDPSNLIMTYRNTLARFNPSSAKQVRYQSQYLYRTLMEAPLQHIQTHKLYILADGFLQLLPFETLQNATGQDLFQRFEISYLPALGLLDQPWLAHFNPTERGVIGNPSYQSPNTSIAAPPQWPALKHGFWTEDDPRVATGNNATRTRFFEAMQSPISILHASAHATLNYEVPELSALVLATTNTQGEKVANHVFAYELETQVCKPALVVLAACRTGDGFWYRGEGIWGLSYGFLAAGSRAVLVSLWDVDDKATSLLMENFYASLDAGHPPGAALMNAKAKLRTHSVYKLPGYWSGFVLHGDLLLKK